VVGRLSIPPRTNRAALSRRRVSGFGVTHTGKIEDTIDVFATVRLELESRPESITLIRSALAGIGEFLGLDAELLDDLKTAISEACNNVVLHAYGDGTGPLEFSLVVDPDSVDVTVRDRGSGISRISAAEDRMGVGLAVISALATKAEFESEPGEGTVVRMSFGTRGLAPPPATPVGSSDEAPVQIPGDVAASIAPVELLSAVMGRLVRAAAAGANFSVDRFPALHDLTTAMSSAAGGGEPGREVGFSITLGGQQLALRAGPLPEGSGASIAGGGGSSAMDEIVESVRTDRFAGGELVLVTVAEPRS
jgi:serine/threonine-protein kinase RsbW